MGTCFSSAFANIFLYFYEKNFNGIEFFRYINDLVVFKCDNFKEISKKIYPKNLTLIRTDTSDNISFLDQKIKINNDK